MNYKHFFFWTREFKTMYASMQKVYFFVLHIAITSNWNSFLYIIKTHGNFKWYEIKFVNTMHKDTRVVTSSKILNFYQNWPICIKTSLTAQKTNQVVWHFAAYRVFGCKWNSLVIWRGGHEALLPGVEKIKCYHIFTFSLSDKTYNILEN